MATGDHDWAVSEVVSAANMDDYLQLQVVAQYATAAARDAALSARKREGMVTYQIDTNTLTVYSGAAWSTIGPAHSGLLAWTPAITQSGAVTYNTQTATYSRVGRLITARFNLNVTGTGSASNVVTVSLPVTAATSDPDDVVGYGYIYDNSAVLGYDGVIVLASTTTVKFKSNSAGAGAALVYLGASVLTAALAVNDTVTGLITYEAAGDA